MRILRLTACTDPEYAEFASLQLVEYARQLGRTGEITPEQSLAESHERLRDLSADRLRSTGHDFLIARSDSGARVGWVWLSPAPEFLGAGHEKTRWLSQITVDEIWRGQGWGNAILEAAERWEIERGTEEICLSVFNWNRAAISR